MAVRTTQGAVARVEVAALTVGGPRAVAALTAGGPRAVSAWWWSGPPPGRAHGSWASRNLRQTGISSKFMSYYIGNLSTWLKSTFFASTLCLIEF